MKNATRLLTLTKKLSLSLLILALPEIVQADSVPATVTSIKGDVVVTDATGKTVAVTQGSKLPAGDTIKTGANGTVGLTLTPGSGTVVMPNTTAKISSLDFSKGAGGGNNRTVRLNLKNGTLISTLFKKDGHSDFQVATPYGVAAAKGTSWEVTVSGKKMTVSVANGVVSVTNPATGRAVSVPGGQGYDTFTGKITDLPADVVNSIVSVISTFLPNLTQQQVINALNNATINPATDNSKNAINSPNQ